MSKNLIVIGGGAAGFFCAVNAARMHPGLKVILLEKSNKLLSKVRISGGGRCNVTHHLFDSIEMSRKYPRGQHFVKKAFHQFFTTDTIRWFDERGVKLKAEEDGRMFPVTDSSQTIIDCLVKEANRHKVEIRMNTEVKKINILPKGQHPIATGSIFNVLLGSARTPLESPSGQCPGGEMLEADFVCIACGGYPKSSMFDWLKELGHSIEDPVPSLFTFNMPGNPITKLMGVSVEKAKVKVVGTRLEEEGPLLITHWGLSGPVVLRLSAWGARELAATNYRFQVSVNWLPRFSEQQLADECKRLRFEIASQKIGSKNVFGLPQRLWEFLLQHSEVNKELRWADLPTLKQNKLVKNLSTCVFTIEGKTTFKEEFVTAGGIRLNEINPATMESKRLPHLFFAGEIMDVDGITGGFNFQHAWTSGWVAAAGIVNTALPKKS